MVSLYLLIDTILELYMWVVIVAVVMSWLIAFNVINTQNRVVWLISDFLRRATEPVLGRFRRYLPSLGGIDVSPIVLILLIVFARNLLHEFFIS
ncbi:MAG: YggT family protein [Alphaproteobacteria bacterium]|nr:YggT family protein [Alphaproteobacteria bacterium]